MAISLTSRLREILSKIKIDPKESFSVSKIIVPDGLLQKIKAHMLERSKGHQHEKQIIQNEIFNNGLEDIINPILHKLASVGYLYEKQAAVVEECLKYAIGFIVANYPMHIRWYPFRAGIDYPSKEVKQIDKLIDLTSTSYFTPYFEIRYAIENSLLAWNGKKWAVTPLGEVFISLSPAPGTVFLLKLEMYLNKPGRESAFDFNPWHMSEAFLQKLYDKEKIYVSLGDDEYTLSTADPNMTYLGRIEEFELVYTVDKTEEMRAPVETETSSGIPIFPLGDDFFETLKTELGSQVIGQALNKRNDFLGVLIENLIKIELSGSKYFEFSESKDFAKLLELAKRNKPIMKSQLKVIEDIVRKIEAGDIQIHLLRSIYPSIEAVLKNILVREKLLDPSDTKMTLGPVISKFRVQLTVKPILQKETLDYLSGMERNSVLHGSISPTDQILESFLTLTLNFLMMVLQDYEGYHV